jgi:cephalosporin hydroxylase
MKLNQFNETALPATGHDHGGHEQPCEEYHRWYYDSQVWKSTTFLGHRCLKSVSDMWNYQEIIFELNPSLIVEFGTHSGGSALFFSLILQRVNPESKVLSVDISHEMVTPVLQQDAHIEFMQSSSADPIVRERIAALREAYPGRVFFILDSDHRKPHVLAEMELIRPIVESGDYVIVEDSNVNGHPVRPGWGEGPFEAVEEYMGKYPDDFARDVAREKKFGFTFAPNGFLIKR